MDLVTKFMQLYGRPPTEFDSDYLEMLRMSKYRIIARPDVKPAKCANCGSSKEDGRQYIDFGLEIDWYGCVFICTLCLQDVAKETGLFKSYEVRIEKLLVSLLQIDDLKKQGDTVREDILNTFKEVQDYFSNLKSISVDSPTDQPPSVDNDTPEPNKSAADSDESKTDRSEPKPAKSTSVSGSKNISSLAELLDSV